MPRPFVGGHGNGRSQAAPAQPGLHAHAPVAASHAPRPEQSSGHARRAQSTPVYVGSEAKLKVLKESYSKLLTGDLPSILMLQRAVELWRAEMTAAGYPKAMEAFETISESGHFQAVMTATYREDRAPMGSLCKAIQAALK